MLPRSCDLRKGRHSEDGRVYLLTTATWQRLPLFSDLTLGRVVVQAMRFQEEKDRIDGLAFVVMPDHLHWLIALKRPATLSEAMKSLKSHSARRIGEIQRQHGEPEYPHIWQNGFHDRALRKEDDMLAVARYVVANPLRAGLIERIGDYPLWDAKWL